MTNAAPQQRRRMTPVRKAEIYEVVLGLLKDVGYEALTVEVRMDEAREMNLLQNGVP
ncbi:hypothetical protein SGFS_022000 [Streptomyces graminofaciens]|uniref:Uncharacterized protein n=2 Tax=Streptomyces graminofaciens TaxID=68212 RepID=A0ABM7F5F9_9ACTN|nr:hypothetical protein SGFS_022000 [Streptomyces graminofaciens]